MTIDIILLTLAVLILGITTFALGWNSASDASRHRIRQAQAREHQLSKWVREHWPNEYAAYHRGITEGYQQGLDQAQLWEDNT